MNIYVASETEIWRLSALCLSTPWVFGTLPGTGCGVLGKSLSLSGAWIYPSVQWRKSDLVKFLGFPWQCKHCSLWVFSLLSFSLVSFSGLHLLPSLDSLFPFFISSLLPAPPLVCFSLVLFSYWVSQTASELWPWLQGGVLQQRSAMDTGAWGSSCCPRGYSDTGLSWHWLSGNWVGRQGTPEVKTEALGRGREGWGFLDLILKGWSSLRESGTILGRAIGSEFLDPSLWPGSLDSFQGSGDQFFEMNCKRVWMCLSTVQFFYQDAQ